MKNFEVTTIDNKKYWISRSVAVTGIVLASKKNKWYVLANKRGSGTPDFQGYWNCPCGYLDFDENLMEACSREIFEECGIKISPDSFKLYKIDHDPKSNRQNVTFTFVCHIPLIDLPENVDNGGEINEVAERKWIPVNSINEYNWAFNHDSIINSIITYGTRRIYY